MNEWLRVDTHVHLHDAFDVGTFLDAAADNIAVGAGAEKVTAALCLTEIHGVDRFDDLARLPSSERIGVSRWRVLPSDEQQSLLVADERNRLIAIIAGRQVESKEGIEVLAIGHRADMEDGRPVSDVLRAVTSAGAIPVIPWGFLKWMGRRGRVVDELLADLPPNTMFGDNGARLEYTKEPRYLLRARQKGIPILPGTDPFPFQWDSGRVGSFGLQCEGALTMESPFADLKRIFLEKDFSPSSYGNRLGLLPFVRNQVAIQMRKRLGRKSA